MFVEKKPSEGVIISTMGKVFYFENCLLMSE